VHHSVEPPVNVAAQLFDAPEGFYQIGGHGYDACGLPRAAGYAKVCRISCLDESQPCGASLKIWLPRDAWQTGPRARTTRCQSWHVAEERIEERVVTQCRRWVFAYDYQRVGHFDRYTWSWWCRRKGGLRRIVNGTERLQPCRGTFGRVSCPLERRVAGLVRFRNCIIVCGRSRPALANHPRKQDRCCSADRPTSSSNYQFLVYFLPQDVTSSSISWPL
jgi:hypothetical protein